MNRFITHSALLLLLLSAQNTALASTTYPYSPSEALLNFEETYGPAYDIINEDLHTVSAKASIWSQTSVLQNFEIGWADGTENGYTFQFIDVNNPLKALSFSPTLENGFVQTEIERTPAMAYGIFRVPFRLRALIPAMKTDSTLLPFLDSMVNEACNTSVRITLKKTPSNRLVWHIAFRSSQDGSDETISCKNYLVSTSGEKTTDPYFSIRQLIN